MSTLKAIREKCLDCCCGLIVEVRECELTKCALHPCRMGKNPFRKKRELTDEQRGALATRLATAREAKASQ